MRGGGEPPVPLATALVVGICVAIQIFVFFFDLPLNQFTLSALLVLYSHQYWRVVTSALFHGGLMHLGFNMMSTLALGSSLERSVGTTQMVFIVLWQILGCGAISVAASWALSIVLLNDLSYLKQHSVGFSGVIFALAVVDIYRNSSTTHRSVMGVFSVPAKYYPWVLLIVLQVLIPNVSFMGHLSGILSGTIQAHGGIDWLLPSVAACRRFDSAFLTAVSGSRNSGGASSSSGSSNGSNDSSPLAERFVPCSDDALRRPRESANFFVGIDWLLPSVAACRRFDSAFLTAVSGSRNSSGSSPLAPSASSLLVWVAERFVPCPDDALRRPRESANFFVGLRDLANSVGKRVSGSVEVVCSRRWAAAQTSSGSASDSDSPCLSPRVCARGSCCCFKTPMRRRTDDDGGDYFGVGDHDDTEPNDHSGTAPSFLV
eukprot:CAMPEP_0171984732 /NCGR_PEP_ID=MMETSP0993-20121228/273981_1 /TAXON_ID=483369 /ORGANISM="non described non described, Strain CCMP2098" /LENGTH=430 /DNA_ID=CAMNT_0012637565 /DNA_START=112 /DNA_END=1404 /DNA_ORIENTATION=-